MQAIYNKKTSIITKIIDTAEQNIGIYLQENEDYKNYPFNNYLSKGTNINIYLDNGKLRPNSEQIEMGFVTLNDDEVLEDEVIRKLTEIEQIEIDLIPIPTDQEIKIDDKGNKYLQPITDPVDKELQVIEDEIHLIEDEVLKSIIQDRMEGKI